MDNKRFTLKELRKINRKKANDIASYLGISRTHYYRLENKQAVFLNEYKIKLAGLYNLCVTDIKF